jgi:uncharacterized lipoprotein YehR (DUF1307 family)
MKRFAKLAALILAAALLFCLLTACGDSAMKAAAGTYKGDYTKFVGDSDEAKVTDEPFSLELKADGTGVHHRETLDIKVTWSLDGEKITLQETFMGINLDYTGTLKDGELHLFNGEPSNSLTCEYVYHKQ